MQLFLSLKTSYEITWIDLTQNFKGNILAYTIVERRLFFVYVKGVIIKVLSVEELFWLKCKCILVHRKIYKHLWISDNICTL